jgi:hypothetical protein
MKSDREGYYIKNEVLDMLGCNEYILKIKLIKPGALKYVQFEPYGFRYFPAKDVLRIKKIVDERRAKVAEQKRIDRERLEQEITSLRETERRLTIEAQESLKENRRISTYIQERNKLLDERRVLIKQQKALIKQQNALRTQAQAQAQAQKDLIKDENLAIDFRILIKAANDLSIYWQGDGYTGYLNMCPCCTATTSNRQPLFVDYEPYNGFILNCKNACRPQEILAKLKLPMFRIN